LWNTGVNTPSLPQGKWSHVCMVHSPTRIFVSCSSLWSQADNERVLTLPHEQVAVDGKIVAQLNTKPPVPNKGPLYSGPKFYPAANAEISGLRFFKRPLGVDFCNMLFKQKNYQSLTKK